MGWKDLPSWLKGGIYGVSFPVIASLILFLFFRNSSGNEGAGFLGGLLMIIFFSPALLLQIFNLNAWDNLPLAIIVILLTYFIIGAVIGLFFRKRQNAPKINPAIVVPMGIVLSIIFIIFSQIIYSASYGGTSLTIGIIFVVISIILAVLISILIGRVMGKIKNK